MDPFRWLLAVAVLAAGTAAWPTAALANAPASGTDVLSPAICKPRPGGTRPNPPASTTTSAGTSLAVAVNCIDLSPPAATASAVPVAVQPTTPPTAATEAAQQFRTELLGKVAYAAAILGFVALLLVIVAARQAEQEGLRVISYWGGFGGSGTGWQLTPAAVSLLAGVLLALATLVILVALLQATRVPEPPATTAKTAPKN